MFGKATLRVAFSSALLLLVACSSPTPAQETTSPPAQPKSHRMPVPRKFSYTCDGGVTVNVTLRENRARVTFQDKSYSMKQVRSGSGTRYSDGTIIWWNKGHEGFLQDETDPKDPVKLAENCKQVSPVPTKSP
jgi:membrane-bound inhibitor of C-type lysozyme